MSVAHERDRVKKCVEHVNKILRLLLTIKWIKCQKTTTKAGDEVINNRKRFEISFLMTHRCRIKADNLICCLKVSNCNLKRQLVESLINVRRSRTS